MMTTYNKGNRNISLLSRCKTICRSEKFLLPKIYIFDNKWEQKKTLQNENGNYLESDILRNLTVILNV